ncbi:MAG: hypothetical protein K2I72_00770 [Bacilli bacterium]|nr:hypothetical protein [Bacilli bacterium]
MENYNQKLRNVLGEYLDRCIECGFDIRRSAYSYANALYKLENTKDPYERLYREYMISVMYLDAFKLSLYRQKECLSDDSDTKFLGQLIEIADLDDLLAEVSSNPEFFVQLIEECYRFRQMSGIGKINIIKSLCDSENEWILQKFPIHQQDLNSYDIEINLDHILNSIKDQSEHQVKDEFYEFRDAIRLNVVGFIRNLTNYDYDNAERLLLEIAQKDYSACKFLAGCSKENESFLDHINLYENYSRRDILNELMGIPESLLDAICNIAYVYVYQEYEGTKISVEELDDCKDTEVMKKLVV